MKPLTTVEVFNEATKISNSLIAPIELKTKAREWIIMLVASGIIASESNPDFKGELLKMIDM